VTTSATIEALTAALAAEREARQEAEARASGAEALVAYYKLLIAKLRREQYGQSSERGRKLLDQLELQLEEAAARASACWRASRSALNAAFSASSSSAGLSGLVMARLSRTAQV